MADCEHPLCALIGGPCSIAANRSRGCTPGLGPKAIEPAVFDEVRALLAQIDPAGPATRAAAVRLAEIIRREARSDRNLLALARDDEPDLAPALAALCLRRR